jgi:hypothetical protein
MAQLETTDKNKRKVERRTRLGGDDRIIDLLERIGASFLYVSTPLGQNDVAKILGMDNNRINEILRGIKKAK